jgi:hypothetical protein
MQQEQRAPEVQITITLEVLRTEGHAALDTNDLPTIASASLRRLEVSSGDEWKTKILKSADDLFQAPGAQPPVPSTGKLTHACLAIFHKNSDHPTIVHLAPPDAVQMEGDGHKATVHVFLRKRRFEISKAAALVRLLLSLATASALTPDPIEDEDDPDDDHHTNVQLR